MAQTDMEDHLEKLDLRLSRVEQILPTLVTKEDLKALATKAELQEELKRFATKEELKEELKRFATKDDLNQLESRQRTFTESVIERMNILFDNANIRLTSVETDTKGIQYSLDRLVQRLEEKHVI